MYLKFNQIRSCSYYVKNKTNLQLEKVTGDTHTSARARSRAGMAQTRIQFNYFCIFCDSSHPGGETVKRKGN